MKATSEDSLDRVQEDVTNLLRDQHKIRQGPNEEILKQTLTVIDPAHIIAVEFGDTVHLGGFGMSAPALRSGSQTGVALRPGF